MPLGHRSYLGVNLFFLLRGDFMEDLEDFYKRVDIEGMKAAMQLLTEVFICSDPKLRKKVFKGLDDETKQKIIGFYHDFFRLAVYIAKYKFAVCAAIFSPGKYSFGSIWHFVYVLLCCSGFWLVSCASH